jgi:hypothetical protein
MYLSIRRTLLAIIILYTFSCNLNGQQGGKGWFRIPGFGPESPATLTNENTFCIVAGAALLSYTLSEFVFRDSVNINYYQTRAGMNNEYFWGHRKVFHQNFGVEKRLSSWFAAATEFNLQQWSDITPDTDSKHQFGIGAGIMTYYRWYILGRKRLSPYIEYGAGLFYGFKKFPHNGTNFTFNLSTQLGIEYTLKNRSKIRLSYGQFHQSNNNLLNRNPGYDANGFSIGYSWFLGTSGW